MTVGSDTKSGRFLLQRLCLSLCGVILFFSGNNGVEAAYARRPYAQPPIPGPVPVPVPVPGPHPYPHQGPYPGPGPLPVPNCRNVPVSPVCANGTKTFPNRCLLDAFYGNQSVSVRPGPCYGPNHPQYYGQFYDHVVPVTPAPSPIPPSPAPPVPVYPYPAMDNSTVDQNMTNYANLPYYYDDPAYNYAATYPPVPVTNATIPPTTALPPIPTELPPCVDYYGSVVAPYGNYDIVSPINATDFNITGLSPANASCGDVLGLAPNQSYVIQTPSFELGSNYPPNFRCAYSFLGTEGCVPLITCPQFSLTRSRNCTTDFLEISDTTGGSDRFCGRDAPQFVTTGTSDMNVQFQSGPTTDRGYNCVVRCTDPTDPIQNITLPATNTINCQCGVLGTGQANRIVGGSNTRPNFYKWIVALFKDNETVPFCAGSLINDRKILSAAHCFVDLNDTTPVRAVLNEFDYALADETVTITRDVKSIVPHPLYNNTNLDYDAAVLDIDPVDLLATREPKVTPICLPPRGLQTTFVNVTGTVIGWGDTARLGNRSTVLQQADVPIVANTDCRLPNNTEPTPRMLCAGLDAGGVDACQGDGGGPLSVNDNINEKVVQVGIVSFGNGCALPGLPGVYTRVTDINDWIRDTASQDGALWCHGLED